MKDSLPEIREMDVAHRFVSRPHHRKGGFRSPPSPHHDGRQSREMAKVLWTLLRRGNQPLDSVEGHRWSRRQALAGLVAHQNEPASDDKAQGLPLTWLGQSCFYFRLGDLGIITDPFLGRRASPLSFSGPRRLVSSPLTPQDLDVDVIVMSHNHYDHLCAPTLRQINNKERVTVVTTLGLAPLFRSLGYRRILELDWYHEVLLGDVAFSALPAYHFSGRSLWDTDSTLWASFGIRGPEASLFFAGDTGYGDAFREVGDLTGPYDLALVPIGAYAPRSVFASVHASPEEAVSIAEDVGAAHMVGMHWGTLRLTTEPFWEPRERFLRHAGMHRASTLAIGETRSLPLRPL